MNDEGPFCPAHLMSNRPACSILYLRAQAALVVCGPSRTHSEAPMLNFTPGDPLHNIQKQITEQIYLGSQLK